jgi:hypothetical protein
VNTSDLILFVGAVQVIVCVLIICVCYAINQLSLRNLNQAKEVNQHSLGLGVVNEKLVNYLLQVNPNAFGQVRQQEVSRQEHPHGSQSGQAAQAGYRDSAGNETSLG